MKNLFEGKTNEQLCTYYKQYKEWKETGIVPDIELGK